jgi:hypothetical protein
MTGSVHKPVIGGILLNQLNLAKRIVPVRGLVSAKEAESARRDWKGSCLGAADTAHANVNIYRGELFQAILTKAGIEPILRSAEPRQALKILVKSVAADEAASTRHPLTWATNLRSQVLCGVEYQVPLRRRSCAEFNLGHLIKADGSYWVKMEAKHFKNAASARFRNGFFETELDDMGGLHQALEQYLEWGRAAILSSTDGAHPDPRTLLVTSGAGAFSEQGISNEFHRLTGKYLVAPESPLGKAGVRPFATSAWRAIVATGVLRETNDPWLAADAIQDTPEVVMRHYAKFLPDAQQKELKRQQRRIMDSDDD